MLLFLLLFLPIGLIGEDEGWKEYSEPESESESESESDESEESLTDDSGLE